MIPGFATVPGQPSERYPQVVHQETRGTQALHPLFRYNTEAEFSVDFTMRMG